MHQYNVLKYGNLDDLCGVIILCDEHPLNLKFSGYL